MTTLLPDPFALLTTTLWEPAARRELTVFGAPVELLWLPRRKQRAGVPGRDRPPFRPDVASRIVAEEALWTDGRVVLTPNMFPFARAHALLWTVDSVREAPRDLLETAMRMVAEHGGTALANCIGSAASIQRAHVHLVHERLPFLGALRQRASSIGALLPPDSGVEVAELDGLPLVGVVLRGPCEARARAAARLLELRTTATFNLLDDGSTSWLFPRGREIPAPHFPFALGAAELWGRWCYGDEAPFRSARAQDLELALDLAGVRAP